MTRKDYELIASRIKATQDAQSGTAAAFTDSALSDLALGLSEDFKRANPNFQPERFLAACGVTL